MKIVTKIEKFNSKIENNNLKILDYKEKIKALEKANLFYRNEIKKEEDKEILNLLEEKNVDINQLEKLLNNLADSNKDNEISDERKENFE